jgi:hypothetical protein
MKLNNHGLHNHSDQKGVSGRVKEYFRNLYNHSRKCKISRGSANILRSLSWARGENWRRNHPKSQGKQHLPHEFSSNKTKHH